MAIFFQKDTYFCLEGVFANMMTFAFLHAFLTRLHTFLLSHTDSDYRSYSIGPTGEEFVTTLGEAPL